MRIAITLRGSGRAPSEFVVSDFVPTTYCLRFKLEDDADPERFHDALGGAGYSSREFALTTDRGQTFWDCRISTETGREIGVDFRSQS
ncbi:MAG TPA: hypothetical protein VGH28_03120 [Polyangiaceae bacterium]|jgi:hypothetical protein